MKRPELNLKRKDTTTRRALERKVSDPVPNPLDTVDYSAGDPEASSQEEASALLDGFRERANREAERFTLATDSEFWFAIGFQSREQKEAFMAAMQWLGYGDKYLNGCHIAEDSGIKLPQVKLSDPTKKPVDRRLDALAMRPPTRKQ